jgi:hypothetical protein
MSYFRTRWQAKVKKNVGILLISGRKRRPMTSAREARFQEDMFPVCFFL